MEAAVVGVEDRRAREADMSPWTTTRKPGCSTIIRTSGPRTTRKCHHRRASLDEAVAVVITCEETGELDSGDAVEDAERRLLERIRGSCVRR